MSTDALRAYLVFFLFTISLSVGAMVVLMTHQLTGGRWGLALRRPLMECVRMMPLCLLLYLPLLVWLPRLYGWMTDPAAVGPRGWWLERNFFTARAVLYLLLWTALGWRWGTLASRHDAVAQRQLRGWSAAGLIVCSFTLSLAAIDWIMSLAPDWYSSSFGLLFVVSQMQAALALGIWACCERGEPESVLLGDFGNLLLTLIMSSIYLAYTQFLIIWAADLPHEISWYLPRLRGGWPMLIGLLVLTQFALPFALLLLRAVKRRRRALRGIAAMLVASQLLWLFYVVTPLIRPRLTVNWTDVLALVLSLSWIALWRRRLDRTVHP